MEKGYKKLIVWQKSVIFVSEIYAETKNFPKEELFGIVSQMRRAAVSIPSNIAEGSGRKTKRDYAHFMTIAYGSALELETQIEISKNLGYIKDERYNVIVSNLSEIIRILNKLATCNS